MLPLASKASLLCPLVQKLLTQKRIRGMIFGVIVIILRSQLRKIILFENYFLGVTRISRISCKRVWFLCRRPVCKIILGDLLARKKSPNGFCPGGPFFRIFWLLRMFQWRDSQNLSRGHSYIIKGQEPMSSQVWQPCPALELPTKNWPQIPWHADQRSTSFQKLPLGSAMVARFLVWNCMKVHGSAVWRLLQKSPKSRLQNPHTQLINPIRKTMQKIPRQNPHPKSTPKYAPKICTKICAQALNQAPQRKGHKWCNFLVMAWFCRSRPKKLWKYAGQVVFIIFSRGGVSGLVWYALGFDPHWPCAQSRSISEPRHPPELCVTSRRRLLFFQS